MSSNKSPLKILIDLAHTRVDEATRHLAELIAGEHACEVKLQMLLQYRSEYRDRFLETARAGIDPQAWRNFSNFLLKLDDAIQSQEDAVLNSKTATQHGQEKWVSEHTRAKAFHTLHQRQQQQEVKKQNKHEQRQTDEHAIKNFFQRAEEDSD